MKSYAMTDGRYCARKEYDDNDMLIVRIGFQNTGKQIQEEYCVVGADVLMDDSCFTFKNGTIGSYKCEGDVTDIVIPDMINGQKVTKISNYSFYNKGLTSVQIPDGVTSVGNDAFRGNKFTSITIPETVTTIGTGAFRGNQLTSITIPKNITTIGVHAFNGNKLMTLEIPEGVTVIKNYAFSSNKLTSVKFPSTLVELGGGAFEYNELTNVTIPSSVKNIGSNVFRYNNLTNVIIKGKTSIAEFDSYPETSPFYWLKNSGCTDATCIQFVSEK